MWVTETLKTYEISYLGARVRSHGTIQQVMRLNTVSDKRWSHTAEHSCERFSSPSSVLASMRVYVA